ncbi:MAG: hypothetical protein WCD51_11740, partial [Anaerolineae bacterium]
ITFDDEDIFRKVQGPAVVTDLGETLERASRKTALSLHGPQSSNTLKKAGCPLPELESGHVWTGDIGGIEILVYRSGMFDGEQHFGIVVPEYRVAELWNLLLRAGATPAGVSAREALRAEARLPSYLPGEEKPDGAALFKNGHASLFHLCKTYFVGEKRLH